MPKGTIVTDPFTRTTSGGWGTAPGGLVWSWFGAGGTTQASDFATNGSSATVSVPASTAYRAPYLSAFNEADVDIAVTGVVGTATGAPLEFLNLLTRGTSLTSYYLGRVQIETTGVLTAFLFAPDGSTLDTVAVPIPPPASSTRVRVRMQSIGHYHRLKVWVASGTEPPYWLLTVTDDSYTGAGWVGCRAGVASGNTNTKPYVFTFDDFSSVQVTDYAHDKVPLQVLWAPGANLDDDYRTWPWADITADVLQANGGRVTISPMGRSDESSVAQPAGCSFGLKNISGDYTPYTPASKNYPNVRRNTPIWVLVGPATRFFGSAVGFTPNWDTSGRAATVSVSAAGSLRRLTQGKSPLRSPLYHAITAATPVAYWPLEDGVDSTQAASGLVGGAPMKVNTGIMDFTDAGPVGSAGAAQPNVSANNALRASLVGMSSTAWQVSVWFRGEPVDNTTQAYFVPLEVRTDNGNIYRMAAQWETDGTTITAGIARYESESDTVESAVVTLDPSVVVLDGKWHLYQAALKQTGSNIDVVFSLDGSTSNSLTWPGFTLGRPVSTSSIGRFGGLGVSLNAKNLAIAHIAFFNSTTLVGQYGAGFGNVGESATTRLTRLAVERDVDLEITGTSDEAMGAQGVDTFVNLARECEAVDLGRLYDGLGPGLTYLTRTSEYNASTALTLDASLHQVAPPFAPVDDDQRVRNVWTIIRKGGSSATYEDEDGPLGTAAIGTYDDSATLNVATDDALRNIAAWLVHLGTVAGFRYPTLSLNFKRSPQLVSDWLATTLWSRIDVTNIPSFAPQHPTGTVSLVLEGYTENISPFEWTVQANCSFYQPWVVAALGVNFGLEMAGQTLASSLAPGATTLSLATAAGHQLFTTTAAYPADFPRDLNVGGWQVHVLNGYGKWLNSNPFFESTASPWTALNGTVARSTVQAHSGSGALLLTPNGVAASCEARTENIPATVGASYIAQAWVFCVVARNVSINLIWRDSGGTLLSSSSSSVSVAANTWTVLTVTATAPTSTTQVQGSVSMGSTPPASNLLYIDQGMVIDPTGPQMLTIDPSPNTVTVPAGTSVTLRDPAALAL